MAKAKINTDKPSDIKNTTLSGCGLACAGGCNMTCTAGCKAATYSVVRTALVVAMD